MINGCAVCESKLCHGYNNEERLLTPMIRKNGKLEAVTMAGSKESRQNLNRRQVSLALWLEFIDQ